jgi:hypothetical protein
MLNIIGVIFYQELCKFALQINSALRFKVLNAVWCTHNIF